MLKTKIEAVSHVIVSSAEAIGAFITGIDTVDLHRPTMPRYNAGSARCSATSQSLPLVHFSSQPEPFYWNSMKDSPTYPTHNADCSRQAKKWTSLSPYYIPAGPRRGRLVAINRIAAPTVV